MNTETQETKSKGGGRPKNPVPPTTAAEVRVLMAQELTKSTPDRFKVQGLTRLLDAFETEEAKAAATAATENAELAAANTELATLREQVAKVAPLEAELADLRTNFDSKIVEARKELVSSAQEHEWKAARAENAAKETLQDAQRQFGARGQQILLDFVQTLVEQFNIPEPDPSALPNGISPLVLTLWGHSAVRAQLMIAYAKSFPEPSDNFKQTVLRFMSRPDSTPDFNVRREVLIAMAVKWSVFNELQRITDAKDLQRRADFLRNSNAILQRTEMELTRKGYGRTEIGHEEQSPTGYTGECIDPEHCACPKHNGLPQHLRVDTWLGTRQTAAKEDINDRHVDTEMLDYGAQLIARENAAKAGKILAVDVPESMRRSPIPLDDNEELS